MAEIQTVTEQVYRAIYHKITSGAYPPGMRLTIKALHEDIGVSSSPIRESLTRLLQDGLVVNQPNVGMRVREYTPEDIEDIFHLMADMDVLALDYTLRGSSAEKCLGRLRQNVDASRAYLHDDEIDEWHRLSDQFHIILVNFAGNSFLDETLERLRMHITIFSSQYELAEENREDIQAQHEHIVACLEDGDVDSAKSALHEHVLASMTRAQSVFR